MPAWRPCRASCSGRACRCNGGAAAKLCRCQRPCMHAGAVPVPWPYRTGAVRCPCVSAHSPCDAVRYPRAARARCPPARHGSAVTGCVLSSKRDPPAAGCGVPPPHPKAVCPKGGGGGVTCSPAPYPARPRTPPAPPRAVPSRLRLASPSHVQHRPQLRLCLGGDKTGAPHPPTPPPPPPPPPPGRPHPRVPRFPPPPKHIPHGSRSCPCPRRAHRARLGAPQHGAGSPDYAWCRGGGGGGRGGRGRRR